MSRRLLPICLATLSTCILPAQDRVLGRGADPSKAQRAAAESAFVPLPTYTRHASRAAFAACDGDADDRLSLFEVHRALDLLDGLRDTQGFRQIDSNSDGFLDWAEFDARYQQATSRGVTMRLRPQRPLRLNPDLDRDLHAERLRSEALQRLMDTDGDGALRQNEVNQFLKNGQLAAVSARFAKLDVDRSGRIELEEIRPLAAWVHAQLRRPPVISSENAERLPEAFVPVDQNEDGVVDAGELGDALRLLHPSLLRWTSQIVSDADRTGNGTLGRAEILAAQDRRK